MPRIFDVATAERIATLHRYAVENGQRINWDFDSMRIPKAWWIMQIFDPQERDILTGRGATLADAVAELHERWLGRNHVA